MKTVVRTGMGFLVAAATAGMVLAQSTGGTARDRVFEALLADPADESLMLEYARLSVAERDYEAAVATLERLIDLQPDAQEARYELALAYFALGANEVARYHLEIYRQRGDLTPGEAAEADAFVAGVDKRESPLTFSGAAETGLVSRSGSDGIGASLDLGLEIEYKLPSANVATWDTLLRLRGFKFPSSSEDDQAVFQFRTGPTLSLDGTAFGARLRPYVDYQIVEDDDDADSGQSLAFGVEYSQLLDSGVSLSATLERGKIERDGIGIDSEYGFVRAGATFRPASDWSVGLSASYLDEDFDGLGDDRERYGLRLGARRTFDGRFLGMEDWAVSGFVRADREEFDSGREDDLLAGGVSVTSYFRPDSYVRTSLSVFDRSSSIALFDDSDTVFTLEAGVEF